MAANSELNCVTCQSELSLDQGFLIHKCLACYCKTCSNIPDCVSCKMNIFDADFIHFDKLESCHFYNECKSRATMKCSCINKAICGQHLINIHSDVPGKKCEPETLHGNYMGIMCSKCNKLFARYVNRNNQQEICVSCFHDADSNDFVPKDLLTYENFKSKLKLINNALDKNIEMNKTRVVEFENSMKQKKKITDEALNRLLKLNNQCNHENMEKHIQMKSLNSEAVVAANKIKNLNMNDILIQAARNKQIDINVTLDKWQTWMKDRVRKLENPSVSCISIEFREDQGTSVAHKIIVRQEQHLGTCNFESCDPDNNMIIAGDDKTQDAISNGPCETEQELPRKRLKVRKGKVCRRRVIRNGGNKPQPLPLQPNPAPQLPFNRGFVEHVRERLASPQPQPSALVPPQSPQSQQRPTIDDMIERLAQQQARERVNVEHGYAASSSVNGEEQGPQRMRSLSQSLHQGPSLLRNGPRAGQEAQGVRQPGASWQSRDKMSTTPLGGRIVVENLRHGLLNRMIYSFQLASRAEEKLYQSECERKRIPETPVAVQVKETVKLKQKKKVVRRNQDADSRLILGNNEPSALSRNREGSSVSNDLENVEDLVSMDESDSSFTESDYSGGSSTGESDSDGEEEEEEEDEDESGDDGERSREIVTRSARTRSRRKKYPESWKDACLKLINELWENEDSEPFRFPVDFEQYPDYCRYVDTPMDLSTIKEELENYTSMQDFIKDMETMFENSKKYNTDKKSQIYIMTHRLRRKFKERIDAISSRSLHRNIRSSRKRDSRYTLRNKRQRRENLKYEDYVTTMHTRKKKSKLKRKNGERSKEPLHVATTTASSCSSGSASFSPSTSFDPSQPSTSGLSSRVTSQTEEKKRKRTRRRVIRNDSNDDEDGVVNEKSVPSSSTSGVNGLANGVKNTEYFKSLVQSEEETDVEDTRTNGLNHHSNSETEIESNKNDTDATEIAGDDETQDAISNGPCETKPALPRKRRKVRKGNVGFRKRAKTVNGSVNGGNKVRLKLPKPNVPIKEEPSEPNDASDVQAKSGPDNATEEDICALCVRNTPLGDSSTSPIDWIACDFCPKWFHQTCVVMPPGFNKKRDKFKCDSCKKKTH